MKMKRIFPFFITCLFIIGLIVSCIVLAIRNYMLTAKLNKQAEVIYDFFEVRDAIISNRHLLDSIAEHSEDNHLMRVFTHVFRGEDIDKTEKPLLKYYKFVCQKDSSYYCFIDSVYNDNYDISYFMDPDWPCQKKLEDTDSLQFIKACNDTYLLSKKIAELTGSVFIFYHNSLFKRQNAEEFLNIQFYKKYRLYSIIKSKEKKNEQIINKKKVSVLCMQLFNDWYLVSEEWIE